VKRLGLAAVVLVMGCPKPKAPGGDGGFRVFYPDSSRTLHTGKRMQFKPAAQCTYPDGREAHWADTGASVEQGALAPGLVLEDGAIAGVPTTAGSYAVTIQFAGVTCAGKPQTDQHVAITLVVK